MANEPKPAKKVNPSATNETKEQTLLRLASKRVARVLQEIASVGNLGAYGPTPQQAAKIQAALEAAVADAVGRLKTGTRSGGSFTL